MAGNFTKNLLFVVAFLISSISISTAQISLSMQDTCTVNGDTISMDLIVNGFSNVAGFQFSINWDETVLDYISVNNLVPFADTSQFNSSGVSNGELGFFWFSFGSGDGENLPDGTIFMTVNFVVIGNSGDNSPVTLSNSPILVEATNPLAMPITVSPSAGTTLATAFVDGPPTAICQDDTVFLSGGIASIVPADVDGGSFDDCNPIMLSVNPNIFNVTDTGQNVVELIVIDTAGFADTCTATVTVVDDGGGAGPTAICQDITVQLDGTGSVTVDPMLVDNGSVGNGPLSFSLDPTDEFTCADIGPNNVNLFVTDNDGTSFCSAVITVQDTISPQAICQDITVQLDNAGDASISSSDIEGSGTFDNCSIASSNLSINSFSCDDLGPNVVMLTINDPNGNSGTCSATVVVSDTISPEAVCQDITVQLDAGGNATITPADVDGGSTDNCTISTTTIDIQNFSCNSIGTQTVTLEVTDGSGNTDTCPAQVTVVENVPPVAVCQDITIQLDATGNIQITGTDIDGGSSDNCAIDTMIAAPSTFTCADIGMQTVDLIVMDESGNSDTCSAQVMVQDNTPPTPVCLDITISLDDVGDATITPVDVDGGSTDNCAIDNTTLSSTDFGCDNVGDQSITLFVTDVNGNTDSCVATVTVQDTTPPNMICEDVTIQLDGSGTASLSSTQVNGGSTDNCSFESIEISQTDFTCEDLGLQPVTLTGTDLSGNTAECIAQVTVEDNFPPTAVCEDITVQLDASGNATIVAADIDGGSTDNCGIATSTASATSFDCTAIGVQNINLTVSDEQGNTDNCTAQVTVEDNLAPIAVCQDITVQLTPDGVYDLTPAEVDGGSTDNCEIQSLAVNPNQFTCDNLGLQSVELIVTDNGGNTDTCTAQVMVENSETPMAMCQDAEIFLDPNTNIAILAPEAVFAGAGGACDNFTLSVTPDTFTCDQLGANMVTLTVEVPGGSGPSTCTATVTVTDAVPPTALCTQDIVLSLDGNGQAFIDAEQLDAGSSDNCTGIELLGVQPSVFDCLDLGTNVTTLTVSDQNGNTANCQSGVIVQDLIPPVAVCQNNLMVVLNPGGTVSVTAEMFDNGSSDNCNKIEFEASQTFFDCSDLGFSFVDLTVTDDSGNETTCMAGITIQEPTPDPIICNNFSAVLGPGGTVSITPGDVVDNLPTGLCSFFPATVFPSAFSCGSINSNPNQVTVTITNGVGNPIDSCVASVTVVDNTPPVAVCEDITISIGSNGSTTIDPMQVDGGSTDNCTIVSMALSNDEFFCDDQGNNTVTLTVTDQSGLSGQCTANVSVDGGGGLNAICMNATVPVGIFGTANITPADVDAGSTSDCGDVFLSVSPNSFDCSNIGPNQITLTVSNSSGGSETCTSTVTVVDNAPPILSCNDIDVELNPGGSATITPGMIIDIPNSIENCGTIIPVSATPNAFDCSNLGFNQVAVVAIDGNGNTATCVAEANVFSNDPNLNLTLTPSATPESAPGANDGTATVFVMGGSGDFDYLWMPGNETTQTINGLSSGIYNVTVTDNQTGCMAATSVTVGTTTDVSFIAADVNGDMGTTVDIPITVENFINIESFQFTLQVVNPIVATVQSVGNFGLAGINANIIGNTITVEWDGTGNPQTLPNGTALFTVSVTLVGNPLSTTPVIFTDIPLQIEIVQNQGGNSQVIFATFIDGSATVNDNTVVLHQIGGQINTELGLPVALVEVNLAGDVINQQVTDNSGTYLFEVEQGDDVTVTPFKDINYLNGVSTFDLVLITQHILNIELLPSPYKVIAADASNDGLVTTFDIVELRRLILQIVPTLPNNTSWRFVKADYVFPNPTNPFNPPFPEFMDYLDVNSDFLNEDYTGVKIGDVTGDVNPNMLTGGTPSADRSGQVILSTPDQQLTKGSIIEVPFYAKDFNNILGYQFTLSFDESILKFVDLSSSNLPDLTINNFGLSHIDQGHILGNWFTAKPISFDKEMPIFTLAFEVMEETTSIKGVLNLNSDRIQKEAYQQAENPMLNLRFEITEKKSQEFTLEVFPAKPNPFKETTTIGFVLAQDQKVSIQIYDLTGKVVFFDQKDFSDGYNEWIISKEDIQTNGIFYYEIATDTENKLGKIILTE